MDFLREAGVIEYTLVDSFTGEIKAQGRAKNKIVSLGLAWMSARIIGEAVSAISHMAVGSNNLAVADGQTDIQTILGARVAVATTKGTTNVTNDTVIFTATFGAGVSTGAIQELALFTAAAGANTMTSRSVVGIITKNPQDILTFTWKYVSTSV